MVSIVPTITASDPHHYREQLERVTPFAERLHIDLADGELAPVKLLNADQVWLPEAKTVDLHVMFRRPTEVLPKLIGLAPSLIILHAEAESLNEALQIIRNGGIKVGLAVLPQTPVSGLENLLSGLDHLLVFGGHLGYQGGQADLTQVDKVKWLKTKTAGLEIAWDGGINDRNASQLITAGVDVLNVGAFIQHAPQPADAYAKLLAVAEAAHDQKTDT